MNSENAMVLFEGLKSNDFKIQKHEFLKIKRLERFGMKKNGGFQLWVSF